MPAHDIEQRINELRKLDRPALAKLWESAFGRPAPKGCQATLLRQALAWHWQQGASHRRTLRMLQTGSAAAIRLGTPGTQLIREWQGQTHRVQVLDKGFSYNGNIYRSLSAIARHITGTPWSGPRFFGTMK